MRLGTFFQKPAPASTPPSIAEDVSSGVSSRRSSVTSIDGDMPNAAFKSTRAIPADFRKWFLPFFVENDMEVAPANRFITSCNGLDLPEVDRLLREHQKSVELERPAVLKQRFKKVHTRARKGKCFVPVRKLVEQIEGSHNAPIDLATGSAPNTDQKLLDAIPMKVLSYSVDVRPPYQGTFTRFVSPESTRKISRRPHTRLLPDINYDYDSEGEWEPPEDDDEDLNSEDEEGSIDNEDEEMGDFLDDANDVAKRRMIVGDVEPVSTGLCWQENGKAVEASMKQYRMDVLDDAHLPFPIDPYSTKYWAKPAKPSSVKVEKQGSAVTVTTMQPPRLPLATVSANNTLLNSQGGFISATVLPLVKAESENIALPISKQRGRAGDPNKPLKLISPDLLPAFKHAVEGSDLTKAGLIEILKKQFPKVAKDAIKDTLGAVAQRSGAKEVDKRWVLN
jgi:chromatin assembly factor 1 subunit A